jgi:amidase
MFPEAIARAKFLDEYQVTHGTVIGPLHGLPFSLKDHFITPPYPTSIGIALLANLPRDPSTETMFVTIMRDLGAIPYVKTNVPTAMMMMETKNNIWGEARNPLQKEMSPGGSSGGECALVAMRGSPLGFGTEIGGSLRHPAAWNHLYALKPSCGRFPLWGLQDRRVSILLLAIIGPVARSLNTIRLFSETLLSEKVAPWTLDPTCVPIPWRINVIQPKGRKLRFGIIGNSDGVVTCHPPVERALDITRGCLEDAGHEVFDWY